MSYESKVHDSRLTNSKRNNSYWYGDAATHHFTSMMLSKKGSKKDPDLNCESKQLTNQFPFFYAKSESNPILNRYRSTARTKSHFNNVDKLNIDTPETIQKKEDEKNPYRVNRPLRAITKSQFGNHVDVQKLLSVHDGHVQQKQLQNFLRLNEAVRDGREKAKRIEQRQLAEKKQKNFLSNREYMKQADRISQQAF